MRVTNHFLESQPIMRNKNCEKNIYGIFIEYRNDIIPPIEAFENVFDAERRINYLNSLGSLQYVIGMVSKEWIQWYNFYHQNMIIPVYPPYIELLENTRENDRLFNGNVSMITSQNNELDIFFVDLPNMTAQVFEYMRYYMPSTYSILSTGTELVIREMPASHYRSIISRYNVQRETIYMYNTLHLQGVLNVSVTDFPNNLVNEINALVQMFPYLNIC